MNRLPRIPLCYLQFFRNALKYIFLVIKNRNNPAGHRDPSNRGRQKDTGHGRWYPFDPLEGNAARTE